ncbi:hypothetical protein CGQ25_10820 [Sinomonas sp. R1AF57]|nr:hypothetical protein CGQ25_10820 [Sinomonas sp. R1AF57]
MSRGSTKEGNDDRSVDPSATRVARRAERGSVTGQTPDLSGGAYRLAEEEWLREAESEPERNWALEEAIAEHNADVEAARRTTRHLYLAEDVWAEQHPRLNAAFTRDRTPGFIAGVLAQSYLPYLLAKPDRPTLVFDMTQDDFPFVGRYHDSDGSIHFNPDELSRRLILHELAHWAHPGARGRGHGYLFVGIYVHFLAIAFDNDVAMSLLYYLDKDDDELKAVKA